jgi:Mg/Co/Ni transporter MgtE
MSTFTLKIDIKEAINKLPINKRIELVRDLEQETWAVRLDNVTDKIRHQIKHIPNEEEITRLCKKARKRVYEKYQSGN